MGIHWSTPSWLWPLLLVVAAGAVFWALWAYDRTVPRPADRLLRILQILRSVVFVLLTLAIAGPVISLLLTERVPAALVVVIEDSGSMEIGDHDVPTGGSEAAVAQRWDGALTWAASLDSVFSSHDPPVEMVFLRGNGVEPINEFRLDDPVIPPPSNHGTDLAALLRQASERMAGRSVRSTVLISDGQETRGVLARHLQAGSGTSRAGGALGSIAGGLGLKVVGVGDPEGTADRVIKDLRFPDTAYEGDEVVVEFAVDHRFAEGSAGASLQARLMGDQGMITEEVVPVSDRVVPVTLTFKPEGHGLQVYRLEVSPLDNERFLENNTASLAVDVRKERSRLLLLTGAAGWDVRFLAQAAASEERIQLEVVFPAVDGLVFADSLVPWVAPTDAEGWSVWEGVVICDWTGDLAGHNWEGLASAVENGLGLLVIPGAESRINSQPPVLPSALASLVPVQANSWRWSGGPLFATAVSAQAGHPVLEGLQDFRSAETGLRLTGLPPLKMMLESTARSTATVLVTGLRRDHRAGAPQPPLLVIDGRGAGRVGWFAGRNLWELAFWDLSKPGASPGGAAPEGMGSQGRRLLRNLLVWTSAGEDNSGLVFTGRQPVFQEGERIKLAAQWRDMRGQPVVDQKLSLQLRSNAGDADSSQVRTFALTRRDGTAGFAEAVLPPLPPGRYSIQLVGEGDPPVMGKVESLVVSGYSIESTQVRMDRRRLVQVAARGGGDFYAAVSAGSRDQLLEDLLALDWKSQELSRRNRLDIWSGWPFLVLVAVLLGLEWFLRRRNGLL